MLNTLVLSFQQTNGVTEGIFVGFDNYISIFTNDTFWQALGNTFYMGALSLVIGFPLSFILASLINAIVVGKNFFKGAYFVPNVVSVVAASILFRFLFAPTDQGLINGLLKSVGIVPVGWFTNPAVAPLSVVLMGFWSYVGYDSLIFLAGLQSVSPELYEAGEIDGCSGLQKWWYITIPNMRPVFVFMIVMITISNMKRFSDVFVIGGPMGNPAGSLLTVVLYIYRMAFTSSQVGVSAATAYVLFFIILVLSILNLKVFGRDSDA